MKYLGQIASAGAALALISLGSAEAAQDRVPAGNAVRSAKSLKCSKEANAKALHGNERKRFRSACMRGKTT